MVSMGKDGYSRIEMLKIDYIGNFRGLWCLGAAPGCLINGSGLVSAREDDSE